MRPVHCAFEDEMLGIHYDKVLFFERGEEQYDVFFNELVEREEKLFTELCDSKFDITLYSEEEYERRMENKRNRVKILRDTDAPKELIDFEISEFQNLRKSRSSVVADTPEKIELLKQKEAFEDSFYDTEEVKQLRRDIGLKVKEFMLDNDLIEKDHIKYLIKD